MSFDGSPRPSQINSCNDPLGPYTAYNAAKSDQLRKPLIKSPDKDEEVKGVQREQHQAADKDSDNRRETFDEEELEEIMLLAKMRGIMNFALDPNVHYEFHLNPEIGLVELREVNSGKLMLKLTPDEMMSLSEKIHRVAGILADRSG